MKRRKEFKAATAPNVNQKITAHRPVLQQGLPEHTRIDWGKNAGNCIGYDFARHYGLGFDAVTNAVQQTVAILIKENTVELITVSTYCRNGFKYFADYLVIYQAALGRELDLSDITLSLIENYIRHLKTAYPNGSTANTKYTGTKSILVKMQAFGWLASWVFPHNPFPYSNRNKKGQKAFSKAERARLVRALKTDLRRILKKSEPLTGYELTVCLLGIALRSGMNPTPLKEMTTDAIQAHPLKENRKLLVLYKRRSNSTHIQSIRHSKKVEDAQTVMADVAVIVEHIIKTNASLRQAVHSDLVFVYTSLHFIIKGTTVPLSRLGYNIKQWVEHHGLKDDNGNSLAVNVSRLRKTFENRIWELSGGDPFVTAALSNHSVRVSDTHYLEAPIEAEKAFHFMGKIRTQELIETVTMIEDNTPISKCSKIPKKDTKGNKTYCSDFLSCVRCRNLVVIKEDLYRVFSFYWLIVYEREQIGAKRWKKYFAHIIRIIDQDIVPQFDADYVQIIRDEAQAKPHPAWKLRHQLEGVA